MNKAINLCKDLFVSKVKSVHINLITQMSYSHTVSLAHTHKRMQRKWFISRLIVVNAFERACLGTSRIYTANGGGRKKRTTSEWPRFCPSHKSLKLSHLLFFSPLTANVVHWCVMEGRVHAQNDEFGHSRVDTHTHTLRKAPTNVSASRSLDRRSLSEPTVPVPVRFFSQHSGEMVLETMWLPVVVKENVTGVNTTQIALEI